MLKISRITRSRDPDGLHAYRVVDPDSRFIPDIEYGVSPRDVERKLYERRIEAMAEGLSKRTTPDDLLPSIGRTLRAGGLTPIETAGPVLPLIDACRMLGYVARTHTVYFETNKRYLLIANDEKGLDKLKSKIDKGLLQEKTPLRD